VCVGRLALLPVVGEAQPPKAATDKCANVYRHFIFFFYFSCGGKTKFSFKSVEPVNERMNCQNKLSVLSAKLLFIFNRLVYNGQVLLAVP
jgi:hypothetical protein